MNEHDSERIGGILSNSGYVETDLPRNADVIVINTCSIREKAEQKFLSELGRLRFIKNKNPKLKIAIAGCIAQQKGEELFKRFPYIDLVFGPDNIDKLEEWINNNRTQVTAIDENPDYHLTHLPVKRVGGVRAWVSIMYGCDNFCAYCIVPYTRGRERSRSLEDIYEEVQGLAQDGYKEVTLLGQNVNSYGKNQNKRIDFPDLLKEIHDISGIERIRFVTSHPKDLSDKLIEYMRDLPKVCEHIHLPLQAGSNKVLMAMNRGYTYETFRERVYKLKNNIKDIAITTDIIVGFPGEDEDDFEKTITALKEIEFDGIFAFKYSKRPGTKAVNLPDHVDDETKSRRLKEVLELQEGITYRKNKGLEGKVVEVLVEGRSETDREKMTGRTRTNKIVNYYGDEKDIGRLVNLRILEARQHSLFGERVEDSHTDNRV
ncbi:MAG: tRNA (N6-isopentenyl adenosine(37)-C2)-methylthiotransferase MiaB [Thermodesulfovibrionia bacterium]